MIRTLLLLVVGLSVANADTLDGEPLTNWRLECDRRASVQGLKSQLHPGPPVDASVQLQCQSVTHEADPILRVAESDCRQTAAITLNTTAQQLNCASGEFVTRIDSAYSTNKPRM